MGCRPNPHYRCEGCGRDCGANTGVGGTLIPAPQFSRRNLDKSFAAAALTNTWTRAGQPALPTKKGDAMIECCSRNGWFILYEPKISPCI